MDAISIKDVSLNYGQRRGVENINLAVRPGEIFGFLGPNGAGKSTTIRVLMGLLRASQGTAKILNLDCWIESAGIKRQVGYLPGDVRLYSWMTGKNALQISSEIRKSQDVNRQGQQLLERFQLEPNVPVSKMSKGMRQKLGIVLALAHRPSVLIMDEPTSGLDPLMCEELYRCLREAAATDATVFFSSHTLAEVERLCERVAIVRSGRIVADETIDSLRERASRAVTIRFRQDQLADEIEPPDCLLLGERTFKVWRGEIIGTTSELIAWAAQQDIEDIEISPPSLESLFHRYYLPSEETE